MLISHSKRFVFIEIPRTASRAMGKSLKSVAGSEQQQLPHHTMDIPKDCTDYFTFACVRNPYSREVSHYLYRRRKRNNNMNKFASNWSFEEYIDWSTDLKKPPHFHDYPQNTHLKGKRIDLILKFEKLPEDFYKLPFITPNISFHRLNENPPVIWQNFYSEQVAMKVYEWSKNDFSQYDYDENSWKEDSILNPIYILPSQFYWFFRQQKIYKLILKAQRRIRNLIS